MNINFAFRSEILPQAILHHPISFDEYHIFSTDIIKCPATKEYNRNKFVIPFPFDFHIKFKIDQEKTDITEISHDFEITFKKILEVRVRRDNQITLEIKPLQAIFWSDYSCLLESNGKSFTNTINLGGTFDIKKWIRPIHCSYVLEQNKEQTISFKKGEPWLYLKFHTKEKVKLKYNFDQSIIEESLKMGGATLFTSGFKKYFKIFDKIRPKKLTK